MKKIVVLLGLLFSSCQTHFNLKSWQNTSSLNPQNLTAYPVSLNPYGFTVLSIPDLKGEDLTAPKGWWHDAMVYEVYIRSFQDSDGDGHGDLQGLIQRLDYITNLGFNAIWMLPVFKSYYDGSRGRALGYEAEDYRDINPYYGNLSTFSNLIQECHKRGIRVVMDMVINHAATNIDFFQASLTNNPRYADWFIWTNANINNLEKSGWKLPWGSGHAWDVWHFNKTRNALFYATWGAEFNFQNRNVRQEFKDIARYWINRGVDGFRMDAIRYLIEEGPGKKQADTKSSLDYLKEYQQSLKQTSSNVMTVGEVWTGDGIVSRYYLDGKGFDQSFSFDFHYRLKDALKGESALPLKGYIGNHRNAPEWFFSRFIDNHDVNRMMTDFRNNYAKAKLAAGILFTLPGTPYVYYGDEIGILGQQTPMTWNASAHAGFSTNRPWLRPSFHKDPRNVAAQINDPDSLWNTYRSLIRLRKENPGLRVGTLHSLRTGNRQILAYLRRGSQGSFLIIANFGSNEVNVKIDLSKVLTNLQKSYQVIGTGW